MSARALVFVSGDLTLAVPARLGRETFIFQRLTPLPGGQAALLGLTEVRGRSVPLLNLPSLLGQTPPDSLPKLALLLEVQGELLALPVTRVDGVITVDHLPSTSELLAEAVLSGTTPVHALNFDMLAAAVRTRIIPA